MKIYLTHCSAKKNDHLKDTGVKVPPDALYTATPTQRFMKTCKERGVRWAIFSDLHGVWFPEVEHEWYEKDPDNVNQDQFLTLLSNFDTRLADFEEIYFYYNPGRFHPLYKSLLEQSRLRVKLRMITHLSQIA